MTGAILVGVDGSAPSRAAIRWSVHRAAHLATTSSSAPGVLLTHIIDDPQSVPGAYIADEAKRRGSAFLRAEKEYAHLIDRSVHLDTRLLQGDPLEELAAASEHMVMLAIGTHKTGFVQGRVFGSKYIQLAARAFTPVAFIPNSTAHRHGGVVVGVGDADEEQATIEFAATEAARGGQLLTIIHCSGRLGEGSGGAGSGGAGGGGAGSGGAPDFPGGGEPGRFGSRGDRALDANARVLDRAQEIAQLRHPTLVVRTRGLKRPVAEGLVDASMSASLLVIGRSHRNRDVPGTVGSIVHDVLMNLAGPTVVVHDSAPVRRHSFARPRRLPAAIL